MINSAYGCSAESGLRRDLGIDYSLAEHSCRFESAGHFKNFRGSTDILEKAFAFIEVFFTDA